MSEEKIKKIVAACTATAVLLLFILLSVMVYQMFLIKKSDAEIEKLSNEIAELEQKNSETEDAIELWMGEFKIEERARELGWIYGVDK